MKTTDNPLQWDRTSAMPMTKTQPPSRPVIDKRLFAAVVIATAILAIVLYPFPQAVNYFFPVILGLVATVTAFQMLRATSAARPRIALVMLPLLAGLATSWITGQFLFALLERQSQLR